MKKVLEIKDLEVEFTINANKKTKKLKALKGVNLDLFENEIIAIVGESASGKSTIAMTIMGLLDKKAKITNGQIIFEKDNLIQKSEKEMQKIRGKRISIVFQDPFSSLNPTMKIGKQIKEAIMSKPTKQKVYELLKDVGIQDEIMRYNQYPHQISGGMRQRVMIAIAIAANPKIILADEPTTSLDTTYQMQILDLFKNINKKYGSSIIFISHDLSLIANIASKIYVMYAGKIVEKALSHKILETPKHPFTKLLIDSAIKIDEDKKKTDKFYGLNLFKRAKICLFHEICPIKKEICASTYPEDISISPDHIVACHHYKNKSKKALKTWIKSSSLSKI
ncbi:MAG: Oligopeptide transport ATP-binding protein OppD [Candidatus Anoxychlamydiales bacterium]|nr:Oligopeptide transport ATP-binding protein OppD [Candidatus Anoxychlamydiales bacterium]NGX35939.1 Oligopeptide transport ATP-binding protein OppD [Candidatus Anoxychlamydiales bacterium]